MSESDSVLLCPITLKWRTGKQDVSSCQFALHLFKQQDSYALELGGYWF